MSRSNLLALVIAVILAAMALTWYRQNIEQFFSRNLATLAEDLISTPPPLRGPREAREGQLTRAGILSETNRHRAQAERRSLTANIQLNAAAELKLKDMFTHQYFDHVGPDGNGPSHWVEVAGYSYIRVGENLALGNFASDADLVQAWMDSPGHRANILSAGFTEIGIAVGQGNFEGQSTWLAVQTFGLPSSACPAAPTSQLKQFQQKESLLTAGGKDLERVQIEIKTLEAEIDRLSAEGQAKIAAGNAKIEEGNRVYKETGSREQADPYWQEGERLQQEGQALLDQARAKLDQLKSLTNTYNNQVTQIKQLDEELRQLASTLNRSISTYNNCISQ